MPINMFQYRDPSTQDEPWILSRWYDQNQVAVSRENVKYLKTHHIVAIEFLYDSYKKQLNGVIMNEEEDMNCILQIAVFVNALVTCLLDNCVALIISSDANLPRWHYHLSNHAGLKVLLLTSNTKDEICNDIESYSNVALLLPVSELNAVQELVNCDFTFVVVDDFDQIYKKRIFKRLSGEFNIGITHKNFYEFPDQKMQWTMLNWSNPGCVGKLNDFYELDDENIYNFRDNYRKWWFRLTWDFCESFERPSSDDSRQYTKIIDEWAQKYYLGERKQRYKVEKNPDASVETKTNIKRVRSSKHKIEVVPPTDKEELKRLKLILHSKKIPYNDRTEVNGNGNQENATVSVHVKKEASIQNGASDDSKKSVAGTNGSNAPSESVLRREETEKQNPNYISLPRVDEMPILSSIIKNFEISPEPIRSLPKSRSDEPNCSKYRASDIFSSLIENKDMLYNETDDFAFDEPVPSCSYSTHRFPSTLVKDEDDDEDDEDDNEISQHTSRILNTSDRTFLSEFFE